MACPSAAQRHFSCRNLNDDVIPQVGALQVTANIVFGYATWVPSPPPPSGAESPSLAPSRAGLGPPPGLSPVLPPAMHQQCRSLWSMLAVLGERQPRSLPGQGGAHGAAWPWAAPEGIKPRGTSGAQGFGLVML